MSIGTTSTLVELGAIRLRDRVVSR